MEVLNAAGLIPVSLHKALTPSERRAERRKILPFRLPTKPQASPILSEILSRGFGGGLAALSSVLGVSSLAKALTYEEALGQSVGAFSSFGKSADFGVSEFFDGILKFGSENPLIIGGGAAVLAVPLILSQILKKPKSWGVDSAKNAYSKLSEDPNAQLLDIREGREFKEVGSPDVRSLKKKAVSVAYIGSDKPGFLKKLSLKFKDPENTTLLILDKFDGNSELVAELVTANGFKAAFAIKDGAEGARGWKNSGLPWLPPKKTLNLDFGDLTDTITSSLGDGFEGLPVTLGLAAATGLGLIAVSEIETVLQLLGSAALIQLVTKKLLFAEDRKVTLQQVDEFLNTKVAPKELVDEIKMIGKALLPVTTSPRASLPAPAEGNPDTSASATLVVPKAEAAPETKSELKAESAAEPPPAVAESPRWLVMKNRSEEARSVLMRINEDAEVVDERLSEIEEAASKHEGGDGAVWMEMLRPSPALRRMLITGLGIQCFQQITGIDATVYYSPTIFRDAGIESDDKLLLATVAVGFTKTIFILVAIFLIDRVGRKPLLYVSTIGMTICLFGLGLALSLLEHGLVPTGVGIGAAILSVCGNVAFFSVGIGPVCWVVTSEIFPLRLRAQAAALGAVGNRVCSGLIAMSFLSVSRAISVAGAFFIFSVVSALSVVFVFTCVPETKGKTLEQIEMLFQKGSNGGVEVELGDVEHLVQEL